MMLPASTPAPIPAAELARRQAAVLREMEKDGIDVLILSAQANIEYLSGYRTLSWAYHARPVLALIDSRGLSLVASRTETRNLALRERSFRPVLYAGYLQECVACLLDQIPTRPCRIALDWGQDVFGRGSLELVCALEGRSSNRRIASGAELLWRVRMIKSTMEVELKRIAFAIANDAFDRAIDAAHLGITEAELCRSVQSLTMANGADRADPIAMTFGRGELSYNRWPEERPLQRDDFVWTDLRSTYCGYPADKNRLARGGKPWNWESRLYAEIRSVTVELAKSVKAGLTCGQLFETFEALWREAALPSIYGLVGRIGHGGGLDVTEPPSISSRNAEIILPGMILHLEPKLEHNGAVFQFEEIVHVTEHGAEFISEISPATIPVII